MANEALVNAPDSVRKEIKKLGKELQDSISTLQHLVLSPRDAKGIQRSDNRLSSSLFTAMRYIRGSQGTPNQMAQITTAQAEQKTRDFLKKVNDFFENDWKDYRAKVEAAQSPIFKNYNKIKLE